jgi:hypothetical protein
MCQTKLGLCILRVGAPKKKAARKKGTKYSKHETNMPKERERERVCVCVSLSSALIQDSINPREKVSIHPRRIFPIFHQL